MKAKKTAVFVLVFSLLMSGATLPCITMDESMGCCEEVVQTALSNPYQVCCFEREFNHAPAVSTDAVSKIFSAKVIALGKSRHSLGAGQTFSSFQIRNVHGGPSLHAPIYILNSTLLL